MKKLNKKKIDSGARACSLSPTPTRGGGIQRKKRLSRIRKNKYFVPAAAVVAVIALVIFWFIGIASPINSVVGYNVMSGESVSSAAIKLKENRAIKSETAFKILVRLNGGKIQAGFYELPANASMWRIARMLATGDIASTTITVPEGMTVRQIYDLLEVNPFLTGTDHPNYKDGDLFPSTYKVPKRTSRAAVLKLMRDEMVKLERGWEASGKPAPAPLTTWNQIITLASIVQKETPKKSEMPTVAGVYLNRLRINMRLQADPTVVYHITDRLGDMQGMALLTSHLQTDHPYNTYTRYGLPPSPIANVGADAIRSVLNPQSHEFIFFVADGAGGHNFAKTLAEHNANREVWRRVKSEK